MSRRRAEQCAAATAAFLAMALTGCSSEIGLSELFSSQGSMAKRDLGLSRDWHSTVKDDFAVRPVGPEDLVGADGHCASPPAAPVLNFQAGPEAPRSGGQVLAPAPPPTPSPARGIALGMTECEVVAAVGPTDRVDISTGERGERTVVLTYLQGLRPGIYRFAGGRLKSIERAPDSGPPAKPSKKTAKRPGAG